MILSSAITSRTDGEITSSTAKMNPKSARVKAEDILSVAKSAAHVRAKSEEVPVMVENWEAKVKSGQVVTIGLPAKGAPPPPTPRKAVSMASSSSAVSPTSDEESSASEEVQDAIKALAPEARHALEII